MKRLRSPKACAALVMIAWLASLVSLWGFGVAGGRGIAKGEPGSCTVEDLQSRSVELEMASDPDEVVAILDGDGDPARADCIRRGKTAEVAYADSFFLVAYSLLTLALFLFVRALRTPPGGDPSPVLLIAGVLLALAMAIGDLVENLHLIDVIRLAGEAGPPLREIGEKLPGLRTAAFVKMGALALSALVLGALWPPGSRWVWLLRLFAFAGAAAFAYAMVRQDSDAAGAGMIAFAAFWLAAVIHAVAAMADREQVSGGSES